MSARRQGYARPVPPARGGTATRSDRPAGRSGRAGRAAAGRAAVGARAAGFRLPDGSRSVQSPFVWRLFVFLSLIALGLCVLLAERGHTGFAAAWAVIAAGWFGVGMWLWRRHVRDDDRARAARVGRAP